ncbi:hypothetical protein [Cellulomonas wangsupingiae]|uniref:hypothetical protein n=1 Tax=Cellulomonas wangsupingiae TaxID=2968085 RepID=UPI001D0E058A|nr:hypothetical protein [Cellulomonas wangsupingiae]MCM0640740.1 hypothetical protein [Cellulomonas wangsupingiae]
MGRASRDKRRRREQRNAEQRREALTRRRDPGTIATAALTTVAVLAVVAVASGWWADARVGPEGIELGLYLIGKRHHELLTAVVPDGALTLVTFLLVLPAVVLAVLGRRATGRSGTPSRLTGAAVVVAVAVAPAVVVTCVATVLEVPASGWVFAGRLWPEVAAIVSFFVVAIVADEIQIRRVGRRT